MRKLWAVSLITAIIAIGLIMIHSSQSFAGNTNHPVVHPNGAIYNEHPAPLYPGNSGKSASAFVPEEKIRSKFTISPSGTINEVKLMTWGEFNQRDLGNRVKYYQVANDRMVWVCKGFLPEGLMVKHQKYGPSTVTMVFDAETGERLMLSVAESN